MKERQVDPETPRVPKRDIYIYIYIYIQTYNFETVLRDQMPRAKALGNQMITLYACTCKYSNVFNPVV